MCLGTVVAVAASAWIGLAHPVGAQDFDSRTIAFIHDAVTGQPPSGSSVDPLALADARKALQAEGLLSAQRVATPEPDIIEAYGRALMLGTRARQFLPELAEIRNAAIRRDREAAATAIARLFAKAGRNTPDPASMAKYLDAVTGASASEGPEETARRRIEKPGHTIEITDAKRAGLFTVEITTTPPGGQPNRTVLVAEPTVRPDASGTGLEQRAVPVRACTVTAAQVAERRAALNGEWTDQNGATWEASGSGEGVSLVERGSDKPPLTYTGTYRLGRLQASHLVGAENELDRHLPDYVRNGLVGKTSFVIRLDDCNDAKLQGTWESRHVTYDPKNRIITRIHDPYDLALVLTRSRKDYRIAKFDVDYRPWGARQEQLRARLTIAEHDEERLTSLLTDALTVLDDRQRRAQQALTAQGHAKSDWETAESRLAGHALPDAAKSDAYRALEQRRDRLAQRVERLYDALVEASTTRNPLPPVAFENHRELSFELDRLSADLDEMAADAGLETDRQRAREASHQAFLALLRSEGEFLSAAAIVENARADTDELEADLLKARGKAVELAQELARLAAGGPRIGGAWVDQSQVMKYETTIWEPKELLDFLDGEIASLGPMLDAAAEKRRETRSAFVSAREDSIVQSDRLRNGIIASAVAQGLTETGFNAWDVIEKTIEYGPVGALGEGAKKVVESWILGPPSFYEPTFAEAYVTGEGGPFSDVLAGVQDAFRYAGKRAVKTYGTSAAASIIVKKYIETRSMRVYRELIDQAVVGTAETGYRIAGPSQAARALKAFDALLAAQKGYQKAVGESLFRNFAQFGKASLIDIAKDAARASVKTEPGQARTGRLQESVYKELAKMATKKFFAEWLEGIPLAEFMAAEAQARIATQIFLGSSALYWQIRDDYDARVGERREVLRQYDPKNSMRIITDRPFADQGTLRIILRDSEGQWLKSANREVAVTVGGKSATQLPGEALIYSLEATDLSHDGKGGVAMEVIVSQ